MTTNALATGLQIEKKKTDLGLRITMEGRIDESSRLEEYVEGISDPVIIDLAGVSFINSMGVRNWVKMMRALHERSIRVTLERCSEAIVFQLNMIVETRLGAQVESVYAPYECDTCGHESYQLLRTTPSLRQEQPAKQCPECEDNMVFADLAASYFLFLEDDVAQS